MLSSPGDELIAQIMLWAFLAFFFLVFCYLIYRLFFGRRK